MSDLTDAGSGRVLDGKVAIVTGAGSEGAGIGNGRAAAVLLARAGARVALVDLDEGRASATHSMITDAGGTAEVLVADVSCPESCQTTVARVAELWGRVDALVNNVGIAGPRGSAVDVDPEEWSRGLAVNVTSAMLMSKHVIGVMTQAGIDGSVVNMSSVAGLVGGHRDLLYATSKGALVSMTRAMAVHHGADGIRVNCVAPGTVHTPMVAAAGMSPEMRAARRMRSLLHTEGTAWDVGEAVLYLCSPAARWVTGIVLPVDAGASAGMVPNPVREA